VRIPIVSGIYTGESGDFRAPYPRNMIPVAQDTGLSKGYLRPSYGLVTFNAGDAPGIDRRGISIQQVGTLQNGIYRVMGTKLVRVDDEGNIQVLGDVGGFGQVTMDYSFERLSISSTGKLFYWDGATLSQVTDPDLGIVFDHTWIDGYFVATDGVNIIVTELNDPFSVNPLKYGSSEADPDPVKAVLKLRNEINVLNRHTIEFFDNVGGDGFPLQRIEGAQIQKGAIGTHSACIFMEAVAFLGSGKNEAPSIYLGANATALPIATREINEILRGYTEEELSAVLLESVVDKNHAHLYVHLPNQTLVYDGAASTVFGRPIWFQLTTGLTETRTYRARNFVWHNNKWVFGDPVAPQLGAFDYGSSQHYGIRVGWEFSTEITYNEGNGAIFHELELVALPGRVALGVDPTVWTSYTLDGETWSQERPCRVGKVGDRNARANWLAQGAMKHWRAQRFRGTSDAHLSVSLLQARVEPLYA